MSLSKPGIKIEDFLNLKYNENTVSDYFKSMISKIGENLVLNDLQIIDVNNLNYSFYVHNSYKKNIGKIISLILFEADKVNDVINTLSKNICMHIAAMKPDSLDIDDLDKDKIQKEKDIQKELILNSGKPSAIVDKILEGKMNKYYTEVTLLNQSFILDPDKNVKSIIEEQGKENKFKIKSFIFVSLS